MRIRQSELSQWANCRRKTVLQYREGLQRKKPEGLYLTPPNSANLGTIVHAGLEQYYRDGTLPHAHVKAMADAEIAKWAATGVQDMNDKWKKAYNLAWIMCEGYIGWLEETGIDAGLEITGVERELEVPFGTYHGEEVTIVGHIDLEGIDALGRPVLIDHKTVQSIGEHEGPVDFQRLTYAVLRRLEDGTAYRALQHNQLRKVMRSAKATPPFYGRPEVQVSDEMARKHYQTMEVIIEEIVRHYQSGAPVDHPMFYPRPSRECDWACPYYNLCPMMSDGSDWKEYAEEMFEKGTAHVPGQQEEEA